MWVNNKNNKNFINVIKKFIAWENSSLQMAAAAAYL